MAPKIRRHGQKVKLLELERADMRGLFMSKKETAL